jgi:DNA-binding transcriptional ArsR family regulator
VDALAHATALSMANTSHHLQALRETRLVEARKDGLYVHYRLVSPQVFDLLGLIRRLGEEHIAEVERLVRSYFGARDELEPRAKPKEVPVPALPRPRRMPW